MPKQAINAPIGAANASTERAAHRGWLLALFYAGLFAVACWPIFSVTVPPLVDYPNNLARIHILSAWHATPALQENYVIEWALRPNMAIDLMIAGLARFIPVYDAGRLFVAATLLVMLLGTLMLQKTVHGRIGLFPAVSCLLLYNHALYWGFLNYLFTAGLALIAFAGWIAMRDRPNRVRLVVFSVWAIVLFFGHLMALFVYGLCVVGYEIWRSLDPQNRQHGFFLSWTVTLSQFAAPGVLFVHWAIANQSTQNAITAYGKIANKFAALMSPVHFAMPLLDIFTALFLGSLLVWCRGRKSVAFAPALKVPVVLLLLAAVAMPTMLSDVWGADLRLPVIVGFVLIAGCRFEVSAQGPERIIAAVAVILFLSRIAVISGTWQAIDRNFAEFRQHAMALPVGTSLLVVGDKKDIPEDAPPKYDVLYWHMGALAVIERSVFYPTLFTGHTSVNASPKRRPIDSPSGTPLSRNVLAGSAEPEGLGYRLGQELSRYNRLFWIGWPQTFEHLLAVRFDNPQSPDPQRLAPLSSGSFFDLYRVRKP